MKFLEYENNVPICIYSDRVVLMPSALLDQERPEQLAHIFIKKKTTLQNYCQR